MKKIALLLLAGLLPFIINAQGWTRAQLDAANTARGELKIAVPERETIMYLNLARMYPKQFAEIELKSYTGSEYYGDRIKVSKYKKSLLVELKKMAPVKPLFFDSLMYQQATCFARESGMLGIEGHARKNCKSSFLAECCSYGMVNGKDIVMQWLIDDGISSLGHRRICLDSTFKKVGVGMQAHTKYGYCAVADFTN